jgi:C-terminal processing protease CtpA/Prc
MRFSTQVKECPLLINAPVVILEDADTCSAAEDFLVIFDNINRATIVGTPSYGSTGQPLIIDIPGGGSFRICTRWCLYPNGKEFINIGVIPHIYADLSINDYKNNIDSVFDKGIEVLRSKINSNVN